MKYSARLSKTLIICALLASVMLLVLYFRGGSTDDTQNNNTIPSNSQQGVENNNTNGQQANRSAIEASPQAIAVAQCLAENKVILYGSEWSRTVGEQKELFGNAFDYITYVDCQNNDNRNHCIDAGVKGYPTWIDANGEIYIGIQSLETLSYIGNCGE